MLPEHRVLLGDEPCPVPEEILGEMPARLPALQAVTDCIYARWAQALAR